MQNLFLIILIYFITNFIGNRVSCFPAPQNLNVRIVDEKFEHRFIKRQILPTISMKKSFKLLDQSENMYNASLQMKMNAVENVNKSYVLRDDARFIKISSVSHNANFYYNSNTIDFYYYQTNESTFMANYTFKVNQLNGKVFSNFTLMDTSGIVLSTVTTCYNLATFQENEDSSSKWFILLGLFIMICVLVGLAIWLYCCNNSIKPQSNEDHEKKSEVKSSFILNQYTVSIIGQHSIISVITAERSKSDNYLVQIDLTTARNYDDRQFKQSRYINEAFRNIWKNNMIERWKHLESKFSDLSKQMKSTEDRLIGDFMKNTEKEIYTQKTKCRDIKQSEIQNLLDKYQKEREMKLSMTSTENQKNVEDLLKSILEVNLNDLQRLLDLNEEKQINEIYQKNFIQLQQNLKSILLQMIKIFTESNKNVINQADANIIMTEFIKIQSQIEHFGQVRKIQDNSKLEELIAKWETILEEKDKNVEDFNRHIEQKFQYTHNKIKKLGDDYEGSEESLEKILSDYTNNWQEVQKKLEGNIKDQYSSLENLLIQKKKEDMEKLELEQENQLSNFIVEYNQETDKHLFIDRFQQFLLDQGVKYADAQHQITDEQYQEFNKVFVDNCANTEAQLDKCVDEVVNKLRSYNIEDDDLKRILQQYSSMSDKLKIQQNDSRISQQEALRKKLEEKKEKIAMETQEEYSRQNSLKNVQNEIIRNIVDTQKALSDDDRAQIFDQYMKNESTLNQNLLSTRLEQRNKMEQIIMTRKKDMIVESKEIYDKDVEQRRNNFARRFSKLTDKELETMAENETMEQRLKAVYDILTSDKWKQELEKEMEQIKQEMLQIRQMEIDKKEEKTATFLNKLQIDNAKKAGEIEKDMEKLQSILVAASKSIKDKNQSETIFKKYNQNYESLTDNIFNSRIQQEEALKKKLRIKKLSGKSRRDPSKSEEIANMNLITSQTNEYKKLKSEVDFKLKLEDMKIEAIRETLVNTDASKEDITELLSEQFPMKTTEELQELIKKVGIDRLKSANNSPTTKTQLKETIQRVLSLNKSKDEDNVSMFSVVQSPAKSNGSYDNFNRSEHFDEVDMKMEKKEKRKKKKHRKRTELENVDDDEF